MLLYLKYQTGAVFAIDRKCVVDLRHISTRELDVYYRTDYLHNIAHRRFTHRIIQS